MYGIQILGFRNLRCAERANQHGVPDFPNFPEMQRYESSRPISRIRLFFYDNDIKELLRIVEDLARDPAHPEHTPSAVALHQHGNAACPPGGPGFESSLNQSSPVKTDLS